MNCDAVLTLMLDASPDELGGAGQGELATHIRTCQRCGPVAAALVRDTAELAARHRVTPRPVVYAAPRRRRVVLVGGLAAAAIALLAVQLISPAPPSDELGVAVAANPVLPVRWTFDPDTVPALIAVASDTVIVAAPAAHRVSIRKTSDPRVTVVWLN